MTGFIEHPTLASWRRAHGFGVLNIVSPAGDHFLVETQAAEKRSFDAWEAMSEPQLRQHLALRGLSAPDIDDTMNLLRRWATRITNPTFFPAP
jgi:hypothetical protein